MSKPLESVPRGCPLPGGALSGENERGARVGLVRVIHERADVTEQDEEDDHPDADHRELVLDEDAEDAPPEAAV